MGYKSIAIKSLSWVTAFRIFYRLIAFIRTVILARLLTPTQFGQFGIAALILALVEMLTETGINVFLVQQESEESIDTHLNTAWVISIFRGLVISVVIALSSFYIARFFNTPQAQSLLLWMALVPLVRGFINPAVAKFQKHLRFDQEFLVRSSITLADSLVAIGLALVLKSPVSLIIGLIAGAAVEVLMTQMFVKPRPVFKLDRQQAKEIIHSGKWITSAGIVSYFANRSIDMSIGKYLSTEALGFYQVAYKVSVLFIDELVELVNRVAFPVYTRIQGDRIRLRKAFFQTAGIFTALGLAMLLGISLLTPLLVQIFLGQQWLETIPVIRQLVWLGLAIVLSTSTNPLFLAVKKQNYLTAAVATQLLVIIIGLVMLLPNVTLLTIINLATISMLATLPLRAYWAYSILKRPRINVTQPLNEPHNTPISANNITTAYQGNQESLRT